MFAWILYRFVSTSLPRGPWKHSIEAVVLAFRWGRITVAGQRRTLTGFAFKPSHPGESASIIEYALFKVVFNYIILSRVWEWNVSRQLVG